MTANGKPKVAVAKILQNVHFAAPEDKTSRKETPNLLDVLCPVFESGSCLRQAGRLTLKADGSAWRVSIECPTEGLQTTVVVLSLSTMLTEVEAFLASGKAHWALSWARAKKHLPTVDDLIK